VGGVVLPIKQVPTPTDRALTVTLPTDLEAGPQADVRVTLNCRTSTPLTFNVAPWVDRTQPIRTPLDPPPRQTESKLRLTGSGFTATPQSVRFEGPTVVPPVTAFEPGGSDRRASIVIPPGLANGVYRVRLVTGGNASNARTLEILPRIDNVSPTLVAGAVD